MLEFKEQNDLSFSLPRKKKENPQDYQINFDEIVIILKLREEITVLTVTQITRFLVRKLYSKAPKKEIQKKIHRVLDKFEEKGLVKTETIGNFRFAKITLEELRFLAQQGLAVDWISSFLKIIFFV